MEDFAGIDWDPEDESPFTMEQREQLRAFADADANRLLAYLERIDPTVKDPETDRLREFAHMRAFAVAEERVWASLTPDEQQTLIAEMPRRGLPDTEQMARGHIDGTLEFEARTLGGGTTEPSSDRWFIRYGWYPRLLERAGQALSAPGVARERLLLTAPPSQPRKKLFGLF